MKSCELINDLHKIEKMLRSLTASFDYIVLLIEQSKNLSDMKLEELKASLEAHEMRLKQRNSKRENVVEQAVQEKYIKKVGNGKDKQRKNLATNENSGNNSKNHIDSIKKGMFNNNSRKKIDMKEMQCYNYQ